MSTALLAANAFAADPPIEGKYRKEAWCFDQRGYGVDQSDKWRPCKRKEYDTLTIRRMADDLYEVEFSVTQFATTVGTCDLSGIFQLKKNILVVSENDGALKEEGCAMQIEITRDEFKFRDSTNSCRTMHCGRNQGIDGDGFSRRRKK
jgi:hypothetical protein